MSHCVSASQVIAFTESMIYKNHLDVVFSDVEHHFPAFERTSLRCSVGGVSALINIGGEQRINERIKNDALC